MDEKSAQRYIEALEGLLQTSSSNNCGDKSKSVEAWINHGEKRKGFQYAFSNSDLNGYESILSSGDQLLNRAKRIDCLLKNETDPSKILQSVDTILKSEHLIGYMFNSIYELLQRLKKDGEFSLLTKIQSKLKNSPLIKKFLMRKLASETLGIIRKIDYYAFWRDMTGKPNEKIEALITNAFFKIFEKRIQHDDYDEIDFKETLIQSIIKHKILKPEKLKEMITSGRYDGPTTILLIGSLENSFFPRNLVEGTLTQYLKSTKGRMSEGVFVRLQALLTFDDIDFKNPNYFFNKMIKSGKINKENIWGLLIAIRKNLKNAGDITKYIKFAFRLALKRGAKLRRTFKSVGSSSV